MGIISFGLTLVAGKNRLPMPATGNTALVIFFICSPITPKTVVHPAPPPPNPSGIPAPSKPAPEAVASEPGTALTPTGGSAGLRIRLGPRTTSPTSPERPGQ